MADPTMTVNIPLGTKLPNSPPPPVLPVQLSLNTDGTYGGTATVSSKVGSVSVGINYNPNNESLNFTTNTTLGSQKIAQILFDAQASVTYNNPSGVQVTTSCTQETVLLGGAVDLSQSCSRFLVDLI